MCATTPNSRFVQAIETQKNKTSKNQYREGKKKKSKLSLNIVFVNYTSKVDKNVLKRTNMLLKDTLFYLRALRTFKKTHQCRVININRFRNQIRWRNKTLICRPSVSTKQTTVRPRWDSNPQSPAPEADALSIRPLGHHGIRVLTPSPYVMWSSRPRPPRSGLSRAGLRCRLRLRTQSPRRVPWTRISVRLRRRQVCCLLRRVGWGHGLAVWLSGDFRRKLAMLARQARRETLKRPLLCPPPPLELAGLGQDAASTCIF